MMALKKMTDSINKEMFESELKKKKINIGTED